MTLNDIQRNSLIAGWRELSGMITQKPLSLDSFKDLYKRTWGYFSAIAANGTLALEDIRLINELHSVSFVLCGSEGEVFEIAKSNKLWGEYVTCSVFIDALLKSILDKSFAEGELVIRSGGEISVIHPDGFDIAFDERMMNYKIQNVSKKQIRDYLDKTEDNV